MKNVYFILANQGYGDSIYLPYTSACLAAYAWSLEDVRTRFCCADFFYKREKIAPSTERVKDFLLPYGLIAVITAVAVSVAGAVA